jgi:hypothetical protein
MFIQVSILVFTNSIENIFTPVEQRIKEQSSFRFYMLLKVMNAIQEYNIYKHKNINMAHIPSSHKQNKQNVSQYVKY